jgi:nucleolar complex protein 2
MQRSLIELYGLNRKLAYEHVFVYVRQLAIHLRNAMNLKKKEAYQAVYNWQYIHSLVLWSKLLVSLIGSNSTRNENLNPDDEFLHQLIYPLIQVTIGTIK